MVHVNDFNLCGNLHKNKCQHENVQLPVDFKFAPKQEPIPNSIEMVLNMISILYHKYHVNYPRNKPSIKNILKTNPAPKLSLKQTQHQN